MASSPSEQIESLRRRIRDSPEIGETDAERLLEFSDRLTDTRDRRHERLLKYCAAMAEGAEDGRLTAALDDREAAESLVDWIFETVENEEENRNFRVALRVFGRKMGSGDGDELPPSIGWIPTSVSTEFDPNPGHHV